MKLPERVVNGAWFTSPGKALIAWVVMSYPSKTCRHEHIRKTKKRLPERANRVNRELPENNFFLPQKYLFRGI